MDREEILAILNNLDGLEVNTGPYLIRVSDPKWNLVDRWLVVDMRLISQGPVSQTLPANPDWAAFATALGLDELTVVDRGGIRVSETEARLWVRFS